MVTTKRGYGCECECSIDPGDGLQPFRRNEDIYLVVQFEKLWGDMSVLPQLDCRFVAVPRPRGRQLEDQAQLDGWLRDGSAGYVEALCKWE